MQIEEKQQPWSINQLLEFSKALLSLAGSDVDVRTSRDLPSKYELESHLLLARVVINGELKATIMDIEMLTYLWSFDQIYPALLDGALVLFCSQGGAIFQVENPDGLISTIEFTSDKSLLEVFDARPNSK